MVADINKAVAGLDWNVLMQAGARIVFLLVLAVVLRLILHRLVDRLVAKASGIAPPKHFFGSRRAARILSSASLYQERRAQRAQALGSLFKSIATVVISVVIGLMILGATGFNLGPVLASAGVVGLAIGFGAQNLVKDFISGVFMLMEDQYGVGDVIDMGEAVGTVEGVGLRVTRIRDGDGVLWHVRNGEVIRVGNKSQGWSSLLLDVAVAYDENISRVETVINEVANTLVAEDAWRDKILDTPKVVGIEQVTGQAITLRVIGRCAPNEHFGVQRELRLRIKAAFDDQDVRVPAPVWPGQPGIPAPGTPPA